MHSSLPNSARVDFAAKQREFTDYIRDPDNNPPPTDAPLERVAVYRELLFNNINGFLSSNFPVLFSLLDAEQWNALAQDFFAKHRCESPYFSEIPEEFIAYLQNERNSGGDLPFLVELAHYEWVEMALAISKDTLAINADYSHLAERTVALSPLAWPLAYHYPVHKIAPEFIPSSAPDLPTFLVVHRNAADEVVFIEITPMTYQLLAMLQAQEQVVVGDCLQQMAQASGHPNPELIVAGGLQILDDMAAKNIIAVVA
jgi:hypothetical protein